jgi:glycolate oxidase FAD binding subunit
MTSPFEVSGAAHLPASLDGVAQTLLRVEGFASSVAGRLQAMKTLFGAGSPCRIAEAEASDRLWRDIRDGSRIASPPENAIWRISVKPTDGPTLVRDLSALDIAYHYYDWSGGLVWLSVPAQADAGAGRIRRELNGRGHATLVRAPDPIRNTTAVFEPLAEPLMRITSGIKLSCDPRRMLNPCIMYPEI